MNLFELFVKIGVDDQASNKLSDLSSKLGNGLKTAAKIGAAAVGAAASGITALTTAAVKNYAEYEQLVGGAQLMFGNAYDTVAKNAQDAYKTVQMSQNEYLQQVNGFATGLKTALGGNEQAAAELAHNIVKAEADIIAATGNTAENVQNAFNGIMKSNFTMLDNLQLGITPTKEGFQEVIDKVNEWNEANGRATNYVIDNLADAQNALVDYIEMQGLQGYAANEASETIQGSIAAVKGAWENLLTGIADENSDFGELVDGFIESVQSASDNLIPRIETSLEGIMNLIRVASGEIVPLVVSVITKNAPILIESASDIVLALVDGIVDNLDGIVDAVQSVAEKIIPKLASAFTKIVPKIAKSALNIVDNLDGVSTAAIGIVTTFKSLLSGNWIGAGIGLITTAFGLLKTAEEQNRDAIYRLTEQEKEMISAGEDAREEINQTLKSRLENISAIMDEISKTEDLWSELQTLTDENGNVRDSDRERANFLLGELNEALGTEYAMNDGIISQYRDMQKEIDNLIAKKQAELLLENDNRAYTTAKTNLPDLYSSVTVIEDKIARAQDAYDQAFARYIRDKGNVGEHGLGMLQYAVTSAKEALDAARSEYDAAVSDVSVALDTINKHEEALALSESGRFKEAAELLTQDTSYRWQHVEDIKKISDAEKKQLKADLDQKRRELEFFRKEYEKGTTGFTKPMLEEMEASVAELSRLWEEASAGATDFSAASKRGAAGFSYGIITEANNMVSSLSTAWAQAALDAYNAGIDTGSRFLDGFVSQKDLILGGFDGVREDLWGGQRGNTHGSQPTQFKQVQNVNNQQTSVNPVEININVRADTEDMGDKIANEVNSVVMSALRAYGMGYRGGDMRYA